VRIVAWLGGALFVGSLSYLAYFYLVTLASASGDASRATSNALFNGGLFAIFALHHSLLARTWFKRSIARLIPPHAERSAYVWVASVLSIAMCALWRPVPGLVYQVDGWWRLPFWSLQAVGVVMTLHAARVIKPLELAGISQATGRASTGSIQIVGPFRVVRHPIYLAWMLMVFLTPLMTVNRVLFAGISSAYLILAIPWEEKSLVEGHGDSYRDYQRAVRWRVLPGIW
jgi:protein-S-isoprenylcysteine O-methyltransferase Ste14